MVRLQFCPRHTSAPSLRRPRTFSDSTARVPCAWRRATASPPVNPQDTRLTPHGRQRGRRYSSRQRPPPGPGGPGPLPAARGTPGAHWPPLEGRIPPQRPMGSGRSAGALGGWQGRPAADIARPLPSKQGRGRRRGASTPAPPPGPEAAPRPARRPWRFPRGAGDAPAARGDGAGRGGGKGEALPTAVTSRHARGTFR